MSFQFDITVRPKHPELYIEGAKTVILQIVGGRDREPMTHNKLRGSVEMISMEIFEIVTVWDHFWFISENI